MAQNDTPERARVGGETFEAVYKTPGKIWVTVLLMIVGFSLCGLAVVVHSWLLFAVGAVIFLGAGVASLAFGIMDNVH